MRPITKAQSDDEKQMEYFIKALRVVVREEIAAALAELSGSDGENVEKSAPYRGGELIESFA